MIYLDSSALLKLVFDEAESPTLDRWLSEQPEAVLISSELARLEVLRSCRRVDPLALTTASALLDGLDLVPLSTHLLSDAADVGSDTLRTLDAIHLASALALGDALTSLVVYDHRLAAAATAAGLKVVSPGANLPQV